MTLENLLFDRELVRRRRRRAVPSFAKSSFLARRAAEDLAWRLNAITRDFPLALNLGAGALGEILAGQIPERIGTLIEADFAQEMIAQGQGPRLVADEERLPFGPHTLDAIFSVLTLHLVNDLPGCLIQIRRALKPDGLFLGALFGGDTLMELRTALAAAEMEVEGGVSPRVAPFAEIKTLGALLQRAGLALPVADSDRVTVSYAHPLKLMAELRAMGETNTLTARRKTPLRRATLRRACEIYREKHGDKTGRVPATFEIITLTAWAPHPDQQKPLKPGSAKTRLADALGTDEFSAGEKTGPAKPGGS